jgi:hypothetical protein
MNSQHQTVNPWTWQDQFGFAQAVVATAPSRWLFLAGQGPADADGNVVHQGDMAGQLNQALDNLEGTGRTPLTSAAWPAWRHPRSRWGESSRRPVGCAQRIQ